jgi:hypothetical protein
MKRRWLRYLQMAVAKCRRQLLANVIAGVAPAARDELKDQQ